MSTRFVIRAMIAMMMTASAARAAPKDDAIAAAKKVAESDNYSWTTEAIGAGGAGGGGAEGKTQKDGLTMLNLGLRGQMTQVFFQGERGAYQGADGAWHSIADAAGEADPSGQMIASMVKTYQPPGVQAVTLANQLQDPQQQPDGTISGKLSPDDAKALMERRMIRRAGAGQISDPRATIKFVLQDGVLVKMELHMQGVLTAGGNEQVIDRMTHVTIKDVGTTKIDIPPDAAAKMK